MPRSAPPHPTRSKPTRPPALLRNPSALKAEGVIPVRFLNCALRWATLLKPVRKVGSGLLCILAPQHPRMHKLLLPALLLSVLTTAQAQQMDLSWATSAANGIVKVKFAANGDVFALGSGSNVALQRYSAGGIAVWTKTLSAPDLRAIDMDVDGTDNVYVPGLHHRPAGP